MWLMTPQGFYSIVRKPDDIAAGTLTVRARVREDLDHLRAGALPGLGPTLDHAGTDYPFRARAPRAEVAQALAQMIEHLDYDNFKDAVAKLQGAKRASHYHKVWSILFGLQGKA